eukprot:COSAG03_NODE_3005_length_2293_cov_1.734275_1_plen_110_part_10
MCHQKIVHRRLGQMATIHRNDLSARVIRRVHPPGEIDECPRLHVCAYAVTHVAVTHVAVSHVAAGGHKSGLDMSESTRDHGGWPPGAGPTSRGVCCSSGRGGVRRQTPSH